MRRWRLGSLGDIELFVHPAVVPFAVYACCVGCGTLWIISFLSILAHEGAHAIVARVLKGSPSSIEITPIGAVLLLEDDMKLSPLRRALMLAVGPAASLAICGLAVAFAKYGWIAANAGMTIYLCNLSIFLINLVPAFPLDGGRLLHLVLTQAWSARIAERILRILGNLAGGGLLLLNLFTALKCGGWNLSLAFAGCSILYATSVAMTTGKLHELKMYMDRKILLENNRFMRCDVICVLMDAPIHKLLRSMPARRQTIFAAFEPGTHSFKGIITERYAIQSYLECPESTVADILLLSQNLPQVTKYNTK